MFNIERVGEVAYNSDGYKVATYKARNDNTDGYYYNFNFTQSPFSNCQVFSLSPFNELIRFFSKEEIYNIINFILTDVGIKKPLLAFDVHKEYLNKITSTFDVLCHSEYTSTYSRKLMSIGIIKL